MRCGFDITCVMLNWFWGLPWWVHWGLLGCLVLALWGVGLRLWSIAKAFGGWQAAVAALGAAALIGAALLNRKPAPDVHEHVAGKDAAPPPPKRKKRPTIFDR